MIPDGYDDNDHDDDHNDNHSSGGRDNNSAEDDDSGDDKDSYSYKKPYRHVKYEDLFQRMIGEREIEEQESEFQLEQLPVPDGNIEDNEDLF